MSKRRSDFRTTWLPCSRTSGLARKRRPIAPPPQGHGAQRYLSPALAAPWRYCATDLRAANTPPRPAAIMARLAHHIGEANAGAQRVPGKASRIETSRSRHHLHQPDHRLTRQRLPGNFAPLVTAQNSGRASGSTDVSAPIKFAPTSERSPILQHRQRTRCRLGRIGPNSHLMTLPSWSVFKRRASNFTPRPGTISASASVSATSSERCNAALKPRNSMARSREASAALKISSRPHCANIRPRQVTRGRESLAPRRAAQSARDAPSTTETRVGEVGDVKRQAPGPDARSGGPAKGIKSVPRAPAGIWSRPNDRRVVCRAETPRGVERRLLDQARESLRHHGDIQGLSPCPAPA